MYDLEGIAELEQLRATAPDAFEALLGALAYASDSTVDAQLLEPARRRLAVQFRTYDGPAVDEDAQAPLEQAAADIVDQFVVYVAGVSDDLREPLEDAFTIEQLNEFAKVLYTLDVGYRLRFVHRALFAPTDAPLAPLPALTPGDGRVDAPLKALWREATRMGDEEVDDPDLLEHLRLRCAWYHQCHTCLGGRFAVDGEVLVDEPTFEKIKDYESSDISDRHKTMLRLVDAYLINPQDGLDEELRTKLLEYFTPAQLVALTLKVVGFTSQKMPVMLGTDLPVNELAPNKLGRYTPDGLPISDYYKYIDLLDDDLVRLPTTKRAELRQLKQQVEA